jgi:hypothetical protein
VGESRETLLVVADPYYPTALARTLEAADDSPEPVKAGVEAVIEMAEEDPEGTRAALWRLQTDWRTLKRLEEHLGGGSSLTTLRIGAAIHLARAELASPAPQLRQRLPDLLELLASPD